MQQAQHCGTCHTQRIRKAGLNPLCFYSIAIRLHNKYVKSKPNSFHEHFSPMLRTFSNSKKVSILKCFGCTPSFSAILASLYSSYVSDIIDDDASALSYLTDLTRPSSFYPIARSLERRIIAHLGPTNSGKTHEALSALSSAPSGVYCGPLRLLAWQVASQLNTDGIPTNMVTGQEIKNVDFKL